MGIAHGTRLAIFGVLGALLAQLLQWSSYELLAPVVDAMTSVGALSAIASEYGQAIDWTIGAFLGVIAGDVLTWIQGEDVSLGPTAGIAKGLIAAGLGLFALPTNAAVLAELSKHSPEAARIVAGLPGGAELIMFVLGVWIGAVVGDVVDV